TAESFRASADAAARYCSERRLKAQRSTSYEHVHDQHLAEMFFCDGAAAVWSHDKKQMALRLRQRFMPMPRSSTAYNQASRRTGRHTDSVPRTHSSRTKREMVKRWRDTC